MKKRLFALLLAVCLLAASAFPAYAQAFTPEEQTQLVQLCKKGNAELCQLVRQYVEL